MKIHCYTCKATFAVNEDSIIYDNGSDMAVYKCPICGIHYLAVVDGSDNREKIKLFKLTKTKSVFIEEEESRIIKPTQQSLIIVPGRK